MDRAGKGKYLSSSVEHRIKNGVRQGYGPKKILHPIRYSRSCVSEYFFDFDYWRNECLFLHGGYNAKA